MSAEPEDRLVKLSDAVSEPLPPFLKEATDFSTRAQFWQAVQQTIKERLGLERYSIWFGKAELMHADEERVVVGVPNVVIQQFLSARYTQPVARAVEELIGRPVTVSFDVEPRLFQEMRRQRAEEQAEEEATDPAIGPRALPIRARRRPRRALTFDDLIVWRANRLPYAAARELGGQENPRFQFIFVCGGYGLGKTALLRAVHGLAAAPERGLDPIYAPAEDWCNDYYHAIQQRNTRPFRARYRSASMLLLDDVQFAQGKAGAQNEMIHTVKHILAEGGRVALSSALHPEELQEVEPAFRALLKGAFPAVLSPPEQGERRDVAAELCRRRRLNAEEEVHALIADRYGDSLTAMDSAITCLVLYAGVEGCGKLGLTAARDALAAMHPVAGRPVGLPEVREAVLDAFPVSLEQLTGRSRTRTVCLARQVGIYLARKRTGASLVEVGRAFGGLTHSTVKHAETKITRAIGTDADLAGLVERLERRLGGG